MKAAAWVRFVLVGGTDEVWVNPAFVASVNDSDGGTAMRVDGTTHVVVESTKDVLAALKAAI